MKLVYDEFLKKVEQSDCKKLISLRQRGKIMDICEGRPSYDAGRSERNFVRF